MNIRRNYRLHIRNNMDEPKFWTVTKYDAGLRQELQDEIVKAILDIGTAVARAMKLGEHKQCAVSIAQQRQFTSVQNRLSSVQVENKWKTCAGSSEAQQPT